jgi:hypothetical protein
LLERPWPPNSPQYHESPNEEIYDGTHREEDASASKNNLGRRENLSNIYLHEIPDRLINIYYADPLAQRRRKRIQNVDRWVKPFLQSLVAALRLPELIDLVLKYSYDSCRRVAFLQLGGERMSGEILFGLFCIDLKGFLKNGFEIGGGCHRHGGPWQRARSGRLIHDEWMVLLSVEADKGLCSAQPGIPGCEDRRR